jgi:hypothetical protein
MKASSFFSDVPYRTLAPADGGANSIRIHDAARESSPAQRLLIASYLAGGSAISRVPGRGRDVFDERAAVSLDIVTDGEWVWPLDAAHYCERYGVLPDWALAQRALDNAGMCPAVDHDAAVRIAHKFFGIGTSW